MNEELRKKEIWNFKYKGIACEIAHWRIENPSDYHPNGIWNGYIYILQEQLPIDFKKLLVRSRKSTLPSGRRYYDFYSLSDYFDMHGGLTYYEVIRDQFTGKKKAVKVGCDYIHLFDEGVRYSEHDVESDLKRSVDKFVEQFPDYLVWNFKDGNYIKPELLKIPTDDV